MRFLRHAVPSLLLFLAACGAGGADADSQASQVGPGSSCSATSPRARGIYLAVLPEAGATPWVDRIQAAKTSVRAMVYMMGSGPILDALVAKAKSGVKVEVIVDGGAKRAYNAPFVEALTAAGAEVHSSDPKFAYMHAKILVVDDARSIVSTGNFAEDLLEEERNYAALDDDPDDVRSLAGLFDADFAGKSPDLSCTRLVVSPVNAKERLVALVSGATRTLDIESMQLADADVRAALKERHDAGVTVRVLLADAGWIAANSSAASFLRDERIEVRSLDAPKIHVKSILVDGDRFYAGSENLSTTSLEKNREVGLVVTNRGAVDIAYRTFEKDWAAAVPFAGRPPTLPLDGGASAPP